MHWKLVDQLCGTTAINLPAPTVLPWSWSPSPRCYRELCPHYRGVTAVTAGKPWSPSPCSCLLLTFCSSLCMIDNVWRWAVASPGCGVRTGTVQRRYMFSHICKITQIWLRQTTRYQKKSDIPFHFFNNMKNKLILIIMVHTWYAFILCIAPKWSQKK